MNTEPENFDQLRRLLALKRHEAPPPGYFEDFSGQVIARIRAGERLDSLSWRERLSWDAPWLERLWGNLERQPALAAVFGLVICGMLITAAVYSEHSPAPVSSGLQMEQPIATASPLSLPGMTLPGAVLPSATLPGAAGFVPVSGNSLFNQVNPNAGVQRANHIPGLDQ